jgi:hypothetical protein
MKKKSSSLSLSFGAYPCFGASNHIRLALGGIAYADWGACTKPTRKKAGRRQHGPPERAARRCVRVLGCSETQQRGEIGARRIFGEPATHRRQSASLAEAEALERLRVERNRLHQQQLAEKELSERQQAFEQSVNAQIARLRRQVEDAEVVRKTVSCRRDWRS